MAKILDMPKLSPTMEEGVLSAWHKKEGDTVDIDDLLAEVETDKATMEFRSFDKGTILKVLVQAGANVKLGQPVAILGEKGEDIGALVGQAGGAPAAAAPKPAEKAAEKPAEPAQATKPAEAPADETRGPDATRNPRFTLPAAAPKVTSGSVLTRTERESAVFAEANGGGRVLASPYVRKTARDRGIDLVGIHGSGPGGRIQPEDLDGAKARPAGNVTQPSAVVRMPATLPTPTTGSASRLAQPEARPLSMMRKTIARRLTESKQTVPHFYLTIDVESSALLALREQINAQLASGAKKAETEKPLKVSVNDLLIKACATALRRVPECNAQFTADAILVHSRVDISVAVAVPDGLVTPIVRDADRKSVVAIAEEVRELAGRARAKKLKPEEMQDGTFSISNLGMFGIDEFSAVINPPEGAILAVGQSRDEPVVKDGQVVAGKKMAMTLSCDHRVVDGAVGASFLAELRALIENPLRILTG
jgi:pyruvate dehydrogenase E2 component (dihydrolipoamide acetyltransferase)